MGALTPESLTAVSLYAGISLLLLLALGFNISLKRRASKTGIGDGGDEKLACAVRAHANHAEWFPGVMIGLLIVALIAGRVLHAWGMLSNPGTSAGRLVGSLLTYLTALLLGAGLLLHSVI